MSRIQDIEQRIRLAIEATGGADAAADMRVALIDSVADAQLKVIKINDAFQEGKISLDRWVSGMRAAGAELAKRKRDLEALERLEARENEALRQAERLQRRVQGAMAQANQEYHERNELLHEMAAAERVARSEMEGMTAAQRQATREAIRAGAAYDRAVNGPIGRTGDRAVHAARGVLEMSRAIEDFSVAGPIGALNNLPTTIYMIGEAAGVTAAKLNIMVAAVSLLASGVYLVYQNWDSISALWKEGVPPPVREGIQGLQGDIRNLSQEIDELRSKNILTAVEAHFLEDLEREKEAAEKLIEEMRSREGFWDEVESSLNHEEQRVADAMEAVTEHFGGIGAIHEAWEEIVAGHKEAALEFARQTIQEDFDKIAADYRSGQAPLIKAMIDASGGLEALHDRMMEGADALAKQNFDASGINNELFRRTIEDARKGNVEALQRFQSLLDQYDPGNEIAAAIRAQMTGPFVTPEIRRQIEERRQAREEMETKIQEALRDTITQGFQQDLTWAIEDGLSLEEAQDRIKEALRNALKDNLEVPRDLQDEFNRRLKEMAQELSRQLGKSVQNAAEEIKREKERQLRNLMDQEALTREEATRRIQQQEAQRVFENENARIIDNLTRVVARIDATRKQQNPFHQMMSPEQLRAQAESMNQAMMQRGLTADDREIFAKMLVDPKFGTQNLMRFDALMGNLDRRGLGQDPRAAHAAVQAVLSRWGEQTWNTQSITNQVMNQFLNQNRMLFNRMQNLDREVVEIYNATRRLTERFGRSSGTSQNRGGRR